uniref:Glutamyl/glutaminyl-tRNA synthetase class Ib catalytic domain-containing protein n=1 Tax=Odontella aurita TaxID=265563 RepID=A0A7S4MQT6_9STRA|mmetsp:Transcript_29121/g.86217  ORF Transcript_29121/g.86217 Transcript_29121/m.86217 type:complete len:180 (+) Transcript_29121:1564-2103(+)
MGALVVAASVVEVEGSFLPSFASASSFTADTPPPGAGLGRLASSSSAFFASSRNFLKSGLRSIVPSYRSLRPDTLYLGGGAAAAAPSPEGEDEDEDDGSNNNPWYGPVRHTSDHFELIHDCAVELIKSGDAYVDSLSAEEMREYRGTLTEPGRNSPYRTRSIEENLDMFQKVSLDTKIL